MYYSALIGKAEAMYEISRGKFNEVNLLLLLLEWLQHPSAAAVFKGSSLHTPSQDLFSAEASEMLDGRT